MICGAPAGAIPRREHQTPVVTLLTLLTMRTLYPAGGHGAAHPLTMACLSTRPIRHATEAVEGDALTAGPALGDMSDSERSWR